MQELGKFDCKINVKPNILVKYTSFSINNKLIFIDGFQFFIFTLVSLVKKLGKGDFKYLNQEFNM